MEEAREVKEELKQVKLEEVKVEVEGDVGFQAAKLSAESYGSDSEACGDTFIVVDGLATYMSNWAQTSPCEPWATRKQLRRHRKT
eukprot:9124077-Pyramimonas_sp.AAC.1